ncbi:MAG: hypothetical protein KDB53_12740, partial [Planctomycetes bacterium]|nr:hypothetical protein [Planctomycetota bacterium]
ATDFRYQGPIRIDKLSFRADSGMTVNPSTVGSLEVRLIEASTSLGGHSPIFEQNVLRSSVVRTGSLGIPATGALANGTSDWIDLEIIGGFQYDPSSGNDLIVELKTCAGGALGASLDGDFTGNGGRFGHRSNCNALVTDFNQPTFVPIVRVDFTVPEVCTTTVTQFPYFEDFNGFATGTTPSNGWVNEAGENSGAQGDWYFRSGSTGTDNTGPTASHGGSGRYAHTEDSASEHAAINLLSPCFDISGVEHPLLRFRAWSQHANGLNQATENLLHVDFVFDDGSIAVNQLEIPASGPGWRVHQIPLATNMPVFRVRFRGASDNNDFRHDLAIDSVYVGSGGSREDFGLESRINFTGDPDAPEKDANPSDFFHWRLTTPDGTFNGSLVYLFGHLYTDGPKPTSGTGSRIYWPISQTITFYNGAAAPLGFLGVLNPIGIQDVWSVPAGLGIYSIVMQGLTVSGAAQSGGYAITPPHYFDLQ